MEIEFKKEHIPLILIAIVSIVFLYTSLNTDLLGEDEGLYYYYANRIKDSTIEPFDASGKKLIYSPFIPFLISFFFLIFGESLFAAKFIIFLFSMGTLVVLYLISKKHGMVASISSLIILISIPIFTHFSFLVYTDVPIAFFSILCIYLFSSMDSYKKSIITSLVLSAAFYTKQSILILIGLLFLYGIYRGIFKNDKKYLKLSLVCVAITALTIVPWIIFNLSTYNYPYLEGLDIFFKHPFVSDWIVKELSNISPSINLLGIFNPITLLIVVFGFSYFFASKEKTLNLPAATVLLFIILFLVRSITSSVTEERYFILIMPQIALFGGIFLQKLFEKNKIYSILIAVLLIFLLYQSFVTIGNTANSVRYSNDYKNSLVWIKDNTNENDVMFTAYRGSLLYYSERANIWSRIEEFPELMTTENSTRIYDILKENDVLYIFAWNGIIADRYIIPETNMLGLMTYSFLNLVASDTEHFKVEYQVQKEQEFYLVFRLLEPGEQTFELNATDSIFK